MPQPEATTEHTQKKHFRMYVQFIFFSCKLHPPPISGAWSLWPDLCQMILFSSASHPIITNLWEYTPVSSWTNQILPFEVKRKQNSSYLKHVKLVVLSTTFYHVSQPKEIFLKMGLTRINNDQWRPENKFWQFSKTYYLSKAQSYCCCRFSWNILITLKFSFCCFCQMNWFL